MRKATKNCFLDFLWISHTLLPARNWISTSNLLHPGIGTEQLSYFTWRAAHWNTPLPMENGHEKKQTAVLIWETILFFVLYAGFGFYGMISSDDFVWAITMHNLLQLLPIIGAVMLMFSVFAKGEQKTRVFLLLNSAAWLIYTAAIGSTIFFTSVASIVSTIAALWKYRKT